MEDSPCRELDVGKDWEKLVDAAPDPVTPLEEELPGPGD